MEDNEDEPADVRNATPVEDEITRGAIDEHSGRPTVPIELTKKRHSCDKDGAKKPKKSPKNEGDCCRAKLAKAARIPKTATVRIYEKECTLPKTKCIPRHCLTKDEWIDILATPSRKCPPPCLQREVTRKIRPVSIRMAELALPPKSRLLNTLRDRAASLPTELVDNLIQTLEGEACLTPEQAERMFCDKDDRGKKKLRKTKNKRNCKASKLVSNDKSEIFSNNTGLDKEAVKCQYAMAENFVKNILEWKCPIPREEFKDIAEVILKRLGHALNYNPVRGEDMKSQQMRFLADIVGSWIAGVLFDVAEARRTELEEECERKREKQAEESEEDSDDESELEVPDVDEDDDDDEGKGGRKKKGGGGGGRGGGGPSKKGKDDEGRKPRRDGKDDDVDDDGTHGKPGEREETEKKDEEGKEDEGGKEDEEGKEDKTDGTTGEDDTEIKSKENDEKEPAGEGVDEKDPTPDSFVQAELAQKEANEMVEDQDEETLYQDARGESIFVPNVNETSDKKPEDPEESMRNPLEAELKYESKIKSKEGNMGERSETEENGDRAKMEEHMQDQGRGLDDVPGKDSERGTTEKIAKVQSGKVEAAVIDDNETEETPLVTDDKLLSEKTAIDRATEKLTMDGPEIDERAAGDKRDDEEPTVVSTIAPEASKFLETKQKEFVPVENSKMVVGDIDEKIPKDTTVVETPKKSAASIFIPKIKTSLEKNEEPRRIVKTLAGAKEEIAATRRKPSRIPSSIRLGRTKKKFQTDSSLVSFDKIFHTIYNAIEESRENPGMDPITNRIHRAVYDKFSSVVQEEKSEPLTELTRDLLDVMSGKIALWLRDIVTESQLSFMNTFPATVESVDVREWTNWIGYVSDTADTWSMWIKKTIKQAEDMGSGKITRGDWADWTKSVEEDALLWRRFYVESLHQAHQNLTMIRDRRVVKTGTGDLVDGDYEKEMKITDLEMR